MTPAKLLTIAIPTYNRAACLDLCLKSIFFDLPRETQSRLEVMVFDNCSTDDTSSVVRRHQQDNPEIQYVQHDHNLGADANFLACYHRAGAQYVQLLSDDDLWLPGRLTQLIDLLATEHEYGLVIMKAATFVDDPREALLKKSKTAYYVYEDANQFLYRVGINTTCISTSIFNKNLIEGAIAPEEFVDTNFPQLAWTIPAALRGRENVLIEQRMMAYKRDNTGGYRLFYVFGENLLALFAHFLKSGLHPIVIRKLRADLQHRVFPERLRDIQKHGLKRFDTTNALEDLDRVFEGDWLYPLTLRPLVTSTKPEGALHKILRKNLGKLHLGLLSCIRGFERCRRSHLPRPSHSQTWIFADSPSQGSSDSREVTSCEK